MTRAAAYAVSASRSPQKNGRKKTKYPIRQLIHTFHRLLIFAAAVVYITVSLRAGIKSIEVMYGVVDDSMSFVPYTCDLIPHYVGTSTIRTSPLLMAIGNVTTPRTETLYLVSETEVSLETCTKSNGFNPQLYDNNQLRADLARVIQDTSYNLTFLDDSELIMPVVDCSSGFILVTDNSATRIFYLMRNKTHHDDVYLLTITLSTQDYLLPEEHQGGAAASMVLSFINDVRMQTVQYFFVMRLGFPFQLGKYEPYQHYGLDDEGFWVLESIPRDPTNEATKVVYTACRTGFYVTSETEQSNIKNLNWALSPHPIEAMSRWPWSGFTTVRDSWAWVHGVHFFFAADTLFNLIVLLLVMYRNYRLGKVWVGDAFMSISSTLTLRGVMVLLTWYVNGFWTLMEFCLQESNALGSNQRIFALPDIIQADLLTIFLSLAGLLGHLTRERVDPALCVLLFEVGFHSRYALAHWFPATMEYAVAFAGVDYLRALMFVQPKHEKLTPMRLWTTHPLGKKDVTFILATLLPTFFLFTFVIIYVPIRKLYRRVFPPPKITGSRVTGASTEAEALLSWKSSLTVFEVATGAALQHRVGLVSDYDNCIYIKGMKFASADGIYCNGYVIANGKWLICTEDLLATMVMIVTRVRFKNVYVYEVSSHTVQQTARLLYPQTLKLRELLRLNVTLLA